MDVADFDYKLPPELIAQQPLERAKARLLHLSRATGAVDHTTVSALPQLLHAGDLLVVNNTRVFPARLLGHRVPSGGRVECLLVARLGDEGISLAPDAAASGVWEALMHPGQKLRPDTRVLFTANPSNPSNLSNLHAVTVHCEVLERRFYGRRLVRLWTDDGSALDRAIDAIGHVPLPPYIKRADEPSDRERYQTIFAGRRGSIAAPTAGLHFGESLVAELSRRGVELAQITLHVGYGTFQPVRAQRVEDHRLEPERYEVGAEAAVAINRALVERRRVIAVGTTTTRTLEAVAAGHDGRIEPGEGRTDLFIYPGFQFAVIGGLLTNFHLPRSSLLMLVTAFGGRDAVLAAYREAVDRRYRFYSYGDAMLVL